MAAIGARWGYPDPAHFSRLFKAAYGVGPRDYRAATASRLPIERVRCALTGAGPYPGVTARRA